MSITTFYPAPLSPYIVKSLYITNLNILQKQCPPNYHRRSPEPSKEGTTRLAPNSPLTLPYNALPLSVHFLQNFKTLSIPSHSISKHTAKNLLPSCVSNHFLVTIPQCTLNYDYCPNILNFQTNTRDTLNFSFQVCTRYGFPFTGDGISGLPVMLSLYSWNEPWKESPTVSSLKWTKNAFLSFSDELKRWESIACTLHHTFLDFGPAEGTEVHVRAKIYYLYSLRKQGVTWDGQILSLSWWSCLEETWDFKTSVECWVVIGRIGRKSLGEQTWEIKVFDHFPI